MIGIRPTVMPTLIIICPKRKLAIPTAARLAKVDVAVDVLVGGFGVLVGSRSGILVEVGEGLSVGVGAARVAVDTNATAAGVVGAARVAVGTNAVVVGVGARPSVPTNHTTNRAITTPTAPIPHTHFHGKADLTGIEGSSSFG